MSTRMQDDAPPKLNNDTLKFDVKPLPGEPGYDNMIALEFGEMTMKESEKFLLSFKSVDDMSKADVAKFNRLVKKESFPAYRDWETERFTDC